MSRERIISAVYIEIADDVQDPDGRMFMLGVDFTECVPLTAALVDLALADDPEPAHAIGYTSSGETGEHKAWRKRQELRTTIDATVKDN